LIHVTVLSINIIVFDLLRRLMDFYLLTVTKLMEENMKNR